MEQLLKSDFYFDLPEELIAQTSNDLKVNILADVEKTYATIESVNEIAKNIEDITTNLDDYLTKDEAASNYLTISDAEITYLTKDAADVASDVQKEMKYIRE